MGTCDAFPILRAYIIYDQRPCGAPSWFDRLEESPLKADLAIYIHVLGVPGQYESVALMLSHKWISIVVPIGTVFTNPVTYVTEFVKRGLIHASDILTLRRYNSASVGPTALKFGSRTLLSLY